MWLGVVVSLGLDNVRIGKGDEGDQITGKGSYVGSLFWRAGKEVGLECGRIAEERSFVTLLAS
jgi:hypothetical protein